MLKIIRLVCKPTYYYFTRNGRWFSLSNAVFIMPDEGLPTDFKQQHKHSHGKLAPNEYLNKQSSSTNEIVNDPSNGNDKNIRDKKTFDKSIRRLKNNSPYSSYADVLQLVYLPLVAHRIYGEKIFIEICHLWWSALEPHLQTANIPPSDIVKGTLVGLRKLNEATEGDVAKIFPWPYLLRLTDHLLNLYLQISPKNFDIFIKSVISFTKYDVAKERKIEIAKKFDKIFPLYLSASFNRRLDFGEKILNKIPEITFHLQSLGLEKPSKHCLEHLSVLFRKILALQKCDGDLAQYVYDLHLIALIFCQWNVDAKEFNENFWSYWFYTTFYAYVSLHSSAGVLNAMILTDMLFVTLKFDQEEEFLKTVPVWIEGMRQNRHHLHGDKINLLVVETEKKYKSSSNNRVFDEIIVTGILKVLENKE